jgi:membrane associated rhomboid family serine protease
VRRLGDPVPTPTVTRALVIAIVAVAALGTTGAVDARTFGLVPASVGLGEWWRLITSAFLHGGLVHLGFNGLLLWRLGQMLEPRVGPGTFLGLAASGMAGGGLGVVALSWLAVATPDPVGPSRRVVPRGGDHRASPSAQVAPSSASWARSS